MSLRLINAGLTKLYRFLSCRTSQSLCYDNEHGDFQDQDGDLQNILSHVPTELMLSHQTGVP